MRNLIIFIFLVLAMDAGAQTDLGSYIGKAIQNSPLLKEYQNQQARNRLDSLRLKAGFGWQVSANSTDTYAPVVKGWGYDNAVTNGANLSATVSVSKEITGARNRQNQFDAISLQSQSVRNAGKISQQELKKEVSSLYVEAYGSWQQYLFENEMLQFMVKQKEVLQRLTQTGNARQTDFLSFMIGLQQQELQTDGAKNQYRNNLALLQYTCGIDDTSLVELSDPLLKTVVDADFMQSPFYRQFEIDSLKLVNADQQIDLSYQPKVCLTADGGYLSSLVVQPYKNFGVSAGVSFSIPLYDGGQRKMQHEQVAIDQLTRIDYRNFYTAQYRQQTRNLWQQLDAKQQLETKIEKQIEYAHTLVEAYHAQLEKGEVQITEYLMAIENYMNARKMLTENTLEKYRIIVELNYWNCSK
ncbi:MAG TPA: TolC family protein [Prolixibacteraceae bacterium]|nr:TolC family protein [Prolixibacteraceae bacterium]